MVPRIPAPILVARLEHVLTAAQHRVAAALSGGA